MDYELFNKKFGYYKLSFVGTHERQELFIFHVANHLAKFPNKDILSTQEKDINIDFKRSELFFNDNFCHDPKVNDETNQIIVCTSLAQIFSEEENNSIVKLNTFLIDLNFRRKGIGSWLMEHALRKAKEQGYHRIRLVTLNFTKKNMDL